MNDASCNFSISTFKSSTSTSFGECKTIIIEPKIHSKHPNLPKRFNFSFKNFDAITDVTSTLKAPNGVTNEAGAKAYAAKLAASPTPTENKIKILFMEMF